MDSQQKIKALQAENRELKVENRALREDLLKTSEQAKKLRQISLRHIGKQWLRRKPN